MSRIKSISGNYVYNITSFGVSLLDDIDAPSAQNTLNLVPGTNVQTYDAATVKSNITQAYTKQQYAAPVILTGQSGTVTLDADVHQDVHITATGNITMAAPTNPVFGKTLFITLWATSAYTIAWAAGWFGNDDYPTLDTAFIANKRIFMQFRYVVSKGWVLMGRVQEA